MSAERGFEAHGRLPVSDPARRDLTPLLVAEGHWGGAELIDRLAAEWRELCDEGPTNQPFYRPEWIRAYLHAFAPGAQLLLVTARIGGQLRAVLPLVAERRSLAGLPLRVLRSAGNVHTGRFDLVRGRGGEGDAATAAVWRFLKTCPGWDKLEFHYVPSGAALEELTSAAARDGFPTEREETWRSPYVPLAAGPSGEGCWAGTDAKFRANLRRRRRKLCARGSLALRAFAEADPAVLQPIYELEESGWKGREGSAMASNRDTRRFYDEIAGEAARCGYLSLYRLELDGRAVAAHFGLAHHGRYFLAKPAYDEAYREYSPGQLLVEAVLADCVKHGYEEFDFMGRLADWKADWTSEVRVQSLWHVFHEGLRGRALHTAMFRMKRAVKAVLKPAKGDR